MAEDEDYVREEIAFIRRTIEEGRTYARRRSADFAVWGGLVTFGYLAIYVRNLGLLDLGSNFIWWPLVAVGWLFSTRAFWLGRKPGSPANFATRTTRAMWLALGISLMMFGLLQTLTSHAFPWMDQIVCALLAVGFFVTSTIIGLRWLRWVAVGWWIAVLVSFAFENTPEAALLGAVFMFMLLCLPGLILWLRPPAAPAADD